MGAIASQITGLTIVYSTVYSDADQIKHQSSASLAFVSPGTGEFPTQMASNVESVSIWWRHHVEAYRAMVTLLITYVNLDEDWIIANIHYFVWDIITHPYPNSNGGLT